MTRERRKPLAPNTISTYKANLERAFGPPPYVGSADLDDWTPASLKILHAATLRFAPDRLDDLPEETYEILRVVVPPTEDELVRIEMAAARLQPWDRAMALMPLGLGLRASETLNLKRAALERAVRGEELLCLRKGGREQLLPAEGVHALLVDLLALPGWKVSWQILSDASERAAYRALYRLVKGLGTEAGISGMRPHKLRHGFATRMERAGASLPQIQVMMDHADPKMTMRYVHPENRDIKKHLQTMKRGNPK